MRKKQVTFSLSDLVQQVASGLNDVAMRPNILNYLPHEKQLAFHQSEKHGRLYIGANRSGKTVGGVCEDVWWLTGKHPYQRTPPPPVFGRVITVDFLYGANQIIIPQLQQWIPPSELINGSWVDSYSREEKVLTLANGSKLEFRTHEQPLEKFAGTPRDFLHVDEECPQDQFTESKLRLVDRNGRWWYTMTPVMGMTWVFETLFDVEDPNIEVIAVSLDDNPYLSEVAKHTVLSGLSAEDREIRGAGKFVAIGGLVLKEFDYERHVIDSFVPNRKWKWYTSIDAGYNNPTAILWHAISPDGMVITFAEHYRSEWTTKMHADEIHRRNEILNRLPDLYIGDPAMQQRQQTTGASIRVEYSKSGIYVAMGNNEVRGGIDKMNEYFRQDKWFITKDCPNLLRELRKYKWKTYNSSKTKDQNNKREEPQKKDDHAIDSCRYMFSLMPDLVPIPTTEIKRVNKQQIVELMSPGTTVDNARMRVYPWAYDQNVIRRPQPTSLGWGEI